MRIVLLVLVAALVAGCAATPAPSTPTPTPTAAPTPDDAGGLTLTTPATPPANDGPVSVVPSLILVQPGHDATVLVQVTLDARGDATITARAAGIQSEARVPLRPGQPAGAFLTFRVPSDAAPGVLDLAVDVVVDDTEAHAAALVRVLSPGLGFERTDTANVIYTGRLAATGGVFNTNDAALASLAFPKTESYRLSAGELRVAGLPEPTVVDGFFEGLLGMQAGESRTVTFPPEKGYGPAATQESVARDETIARELSVPNDAQTVPRATFDDYVRETDQGDPATYEVGTTFTVAEAEDTWQYVLTAIDEEDVSYRLSEPPGTPHSIYPFWPDATVVRSVNETSVVLFTTPATPLGEPFTMRAHWPGMTALAAVNETHFTVRHSPPVGYTYTQASASGATESTVAAVNETSILVSTPSSHPLAGKDLTFDIRLVNFERS